MSVIRCSESPLLRLRGTMISVAAAQPKAAWEFRPRDGFHKLHPRSIRIVEVGQTPPIGPHADSIGRE